MKTYFELLKKEMHPAVLSELFSPEIANRLEKVAKIYIDQYPHLQSSGLMDWVSIKDKAPSGRVEQVLIFNGKSEWYSQCVLHATWFEQDKKFKINSDTTITYDHITHWMPLPKAPTK